MLNLRALHQLFYHSQVWYMVIYRLNSEKLKNFDFCQNRQFRMKFAKKSNTLKFTLNLISRFSETIISNPFRKWLFSWNIWKPDIEWIWEFSFLWFSRFSPSKWQFRLKNEKFLGIKLIIGPAHAPEIEISKKYWMSFPEIRLCHTRKTEILEKFLDEFTKIRQ